MPVEDLEGSQGVAELDPGRVKDLRRGESLDVPRVETLGKNRILRLDDHPPAGSAQKLAGQRGAARSQSRHVFVGAAARRVLLGGGESGRLDARRRAPEQLIERHIVLLLEPALPCGVEAIEDQADQFLQNLEDAWRRRTHARQGEKREDMGEEDRPNRYALGDVSRSLWLRFDPERD